MMHKLTKKWKKKNLHSLVEKYIKRQKSHDLEVLSLPYLVGWTWVGAKPSHDSIPSGEELFQLLSIGESHVSIHTPLFKWMIEPHSSHCV